MDGKPNVSFGCFRGLLKLKDGGVDLGRVAQQGINFDGLLVMGHGFSRRTLLLADCTQLDVVLGHAGIETRGPVCGQGQLKMITGAGRIALGLFHAAKGELDFGP